MIDWFTTIAQLVNFLILVGLLRFFLYGRILSAMDRRQQEVADCWQDAHRERDAASQEHEAAQTHLRQIDQQREQLMATVSEEVQQYRQQLTSKVREEVEELRERWSDAIDEESDSFLYDLRRRTGAEVCAVARRVLSDLASQSLERQIVDHFVQRLKSLAENERKTVDAAIEGGDRVVIVQSSFELDAQLRQQISATLKSKFLADFELRFEHSSDLLCGIALQTNAHKLDWNLRDYLRDLEQAVQQTLEEESARNKFHPTRSEGEDN